MKFFSPPVTTYQPDTVYAIHTSEPINWSELHNFDLDSLLSLYHVDTLYGEDLEQLNQVSYSGLVYPIWAIIAVVTIFIIAVFIIVFFRVLKLQGKKNQEIMKEMAQLVQTNRNNCDAIAVLIEERIKLMQSLVSQYNKDKPSGKNLSLHDYVEHLQTINDNYRKSLEAFDGDKTFLSKIEQALNAGKSNIMARVRTLYGNRISENDYLILAGLFIGMSTASISFITGIKEGTIRVKKSRFLDKFEKLEDSEDKQLFINELLRH